MDENAEGVARRLRGFERFWIHIRASGTFEVAAEDKEEVEKKARTRFDWAGYLDNFELVEVERVE